MANIVRLPQQKKSFKSKGETWKEDTINAIDSGMSYLSNQEVRRSVMEKTINAELFDGKLNMQDVLKVVDTSSTLNAYVPKKIQHRPILRPKIELLVGEASKEPFDWQVMVTDPNSIAKKEENKKAAINEKITMLLESEYSEEELQIKMKELALYFKYTWKDLKEVRATKILKHYYRALKLEEKFNECMMDRLVYGEELLMFDIIAGVPEAIKLDPKKVHTLYSSQSNRISDSDIIVIEDYFSPGKLIDMYYDELKPDEVKLINDGLLWDDDKSDVHRQNMVSTEGIIIDGMIEAASFDRPYSINGSTVDGNGNIRHLKVLWRSLKLVYIVKGIDPKSGERYEKIRSEEYVPNTELGEEVEKIWIEEWWEGTKIGNKLFKKVGPRPVQFNSEGNISKGHPGVVGYFNSTSGGKVVSFLSKMKPYQYLYDIVWDRVMDALKKNMGKIMEVDLAKIPRGWTVEKWMHYAYKGGIAFIDSFKEVTKGIATGKLAGTFNTSGKVLDMETGNYIQQHVNLLQFIKLEMAEIVGITPQREGAIQASATVGSTERSVMQSNNSTAYEFYQHQQFKLESLQILLETSKVALRGNKKLAQNILDDFSLEVFSVNGDEFVDSDYSVFITVSKKSAEMKQSLDMYSQAFMQNGGSYGVVLDILFSDSLAEKRRKIELAEFDMKQEARVQQEQAVKINEANLAAAEADKERDRQTKMYEIDTNNATKIILKEMDQEGVDRQVDQNATESKEDILMRIKELAGKMTIEREKIQKQKAA